MDTEQARTILRKLPYVVETMQWGANLVYWVGDKAIGGKMFALMDLDEVKNPDKPSPVISFYAGPERYTELIETEGVVPAPYFARIYWVALTHWEVFRAVELGRLLLAANQDVQERLPQRVVDVLSLSAAERAALIAERRKTEQRREQLAAEAKGSKPTAAKHKSKTNAVQAKAKATPQKKTARGTRKKQP